MDDINTVTIPYFAHEGEMARMERANKRLWIIIIILIVALIGTNAGWIFYESQFQTEITTETYEAKADNGSNAVLNGDGEVNIYGGNGEVHKDNDQETGEGIKFSGSEKLP